MRYPETLVALFPDAAAFAAAVSAHPLARGRRLNRDAVYMWKRRDCVPYRWQAVVEALACERMPVEQRTGAA